MGTPVTTAPRSVWVKRHADDEWVDEIRLTTVPRFKESGMSGDEWRTSARVEYLRKGHVVAVESYHNLRHAVARVARHAGMGFAPASWPLDEHALSMEAERALDEDYCMQPGCAEPWTVEYAQTHEGCGRCGTVREHRYHDVRRRFCEAHRHRGDSDLDDMDERYVPVPA